MKKLIFALVCFSAAEAVAMETHRERQEREMYRPTAPAPIHGQPITHRQRQEANLANPSAPQPGQKR